MTDHKIGTREEWLAAREPLLVREKEHTRLGDELARQRRELPWVRVEKEYRFDTDDGEQTLAELFDGRSQLLVYHFMFGPSYEAGCPVNSSIADGVDGAAPAPARPRRDVRCFVSQAPLEKLQAYKRRMGWSIPWVSPRAPTSTSTSASRTARTARECRRADDRSRATAHRRAQRPLDGHRHRRLPHRALRLQLRFVRDDGTVYHAYSTTGRGHPSFSMGYYPILDRAPKGRDEAEAWQLWIRRHDEYENG